MRLRTILIHLLILSVVGGLASPGFAQAQDQRKDATDATKAANRKLLEQLPFSDTAETR